LEEQRHHGGLFALSKQTTGISVLSVESTGVKGGENQQLHLLIFPLQPCWLGQIHRQLFIFPSQPLLSLNHSSFLIQELTAAEQGSRIPRCDSKPTTQQMLCGS